MDRVTSARGARERDKTMLEATQSTCARIRLLACIALAMAIVLGSSVVLARPAEAAPIDLAQCTEVLRLGSTGECVAALQRMLNAHGASPALATDGQFGPLTEAAVRSYQASAGLEEDGIVGPATHAALTEAVSTPAPKPEPAPEPIDLAQCTEVLRLGSTGECVAALQRMLNAHGASPALATDGQFGPLTEAAVRSYQASAGLEEDGIVGPATHAALTEAVSTPAPKPEPAPAHPAPTIPDYVFGTNGVFQLTDSLYIQRHVVDGMIDDGTRDLTRPIADFVGDLVCEFGAYAGKGAGKGAKGAGILPSTGKGTKGAPPSCGYYLGEAINTSLPFSALVEAKQKNACVRATDFRGSIDGSIMSIPTQYSVEEDPRWCWRDVYGDIGQKWMALGGRDGFLGYALTDELGTPNKPGRFNHFVGGSIYWSPTTGAHEVHGTIRDLWASLGWENSHLGFPTSDEYSVPGGRQSNFEGGSIFWDAHTGQTTVR